MPMFGFPKWLMPAALVISIVFSGIQAVRASWLSQRASLAERALREAEEHQAKDLETIIRNQRYEITRFRLQLNALGNPVLPYISPEEVEVAEKGVITKSSGTPTTNPALRNLPTRPPQIFAE